MANTRLLNDQDHANAIENYRRLKNANTAIQERHIHAQYILSKAEHEQVYQAFLAGINEMLSDLRAQNNPYADEAGNFIAQIKAMHDSKSQKYPCMQLPAEELNDLLDETHKLLSIPALKQDGTANPALPQQLNSFHEKVNQLQQSQGGQKRQALINAGIALGCAVGVVVLGVMLGTISLGLAAVPAFAGAMALFGLSAHYTTQAAGFFSRASKLQKLSDSASTLTETIQQQFQLN